MPQDGAKALKYFEKALQLGLGSAHAAYLYKSTVFQIVVYSYIHILYLVTIASYFIRWYTPSLSYPNHFSLTLYYLCLSDG